ncbi:MAG: hypothetical protein JOZ90_03310 [Alphaproteobacteria bacterium]|nr:hypothetical protein [Alphaproteobacteria bacterium]MBV9370812.1 hypothetical protein [Alphaproteobacteria bacterium]MBV9900108.1 hypothetical protein [Alphaproteobacteria bacterium]
MSRVSKANAFLSRMVTIRDLIGHFSRRGRILMLPLLLLILVTSLLLVFAGGLSYVAPFVYAIF